MESESTFSILPNEILVKICENMETPTPLKLAGTYSRVYQECSEIIKNRRKIYTDKLKKDLLSCNFDALKDDIQVKIGQDIDNPNILIITQQGYIDSLAPDTPFILPNKKYFTNSIPTYAGNKWIIRSTAVNISLIDKIVDEIISQGYKLRPI